MVNLGEFERVVALSIAYTLTIPFRFDRFADRVVKPNSPWSDKDQLKAELKRVLDKLMLQNRWEQQILARAKIEHVDEGFGRIDALNRIGNQVFFQDLLPADDADKTRPMPAGSTPKEAEPTLPEHLAGNFARIDAPVSFPPLWDVPWFLWAQYDASIFNELVRNAGEALGVNSKINLHPEREAAVFPILRPHAEYLLVRGNVARSRSVCRRRGGQRTEVQGARRAAMERGGGDIQRRSGLAGRSGEGE